MSESRTTDALNAKAAETRDNLTEMGHKAKQAVQDKFHHLADRAQEQYSAGKERLQAWEENVAERVQEAPMKSLLIAAGVGVLLGFLLRRS